MNMTKVKEALNESIVTNLRQTVAVKAPDIYSVTKLIQSDDAMAIRNGLGWNVDGELSEGYAFKLYVIVDRDYSEYKVRVSPRFWVSTDACDQAASEFPNLVIELRSDGEGSAKTTGPNQDTCDEINECFFLVSGSIK